MDIERPKPKPLKWLGSSKDDLKQFPDLVRKEMGHALYLAQIGMKAPKAKPLRGFGGAGVLEVVDDYDGDTYRAVYTVKFRGIVFVLHAFQKKSKRGIQTPQTDIDAIRVRLKLAADIYDEFYRSQYP
jgi:phage-related protein